MLSTVPLRIHLPLLPSGVMPPLLFSVLWESERLSLLSSEPSSDSSFATSEMSFYIKTEFKCSKLLSFCKCRKRGVKQKFKNNLLSIFTHTKSHHSYFLTVNIIIFGYHIMMLTKIYALLSLSQTT